MNSVPKLPITSGIDAALSSNSIDKFRSATALKSFRKHQKSVQLNLFEDLEIESKNNAKININQWFDVVNRFITPDNALKNKNNHVDFVNISQVKPGFELKSLHKYDEPPSEIKEFKKYDSNHQIASLRSLVMQDHPIQLPKTQQVIEVDFPFKLNSSRKKSYADKDRTPLSTSRLIDNTKYRDCITVKALSPQNKIKIRFPRVNNECNEKVLSARFQQKKPDQSPRFKSIMSNFSSRTDFVIKSNPSNKRLHLRLKSQEESLEKLEKLDVIGKKSLIGPITSRKKLDFTKEFQIALFNFEQITSRSVVGRRVPDHPIIPPLNIPHPEIVHSRIEKSSQTFKSFRLNNHLHNLIRIDE